MLFLDGMHVFLDSNRIDCLNKNLIFGSNLKKDVHIRENKIRWSRSIMDTSDLDICEHTEKLIKHPSFHYNCIYLKLELKIERETMRGFK